MRLTATEHGRAAMSRLAKTLLSWAIIAATALSPAAVSARSPDATDPNTLLALPVTLRCDAVPLLRALRQLREQTEAVIVFESALLERARVRPTMRVSVYCREARLERALDLLLGPCRLAHEVRDGAIWVFPNYDWYSALTWETYDVGDL